MDKIRVLLTIDTDEEPGRVLPSGYDRYFEFCIADHNGQGLPLKCLADLAKPLREFWWRRDVARLPAEIVAADYDLSRRSASSVLDGRPQRNPTYAERKQMGNDSGVSIGHNVGDVDFDGLLLGLFYATLTIDHPCGFVPMSYQMDRMPVTVTELQELTKPYLGIDFAFNGETRTWENILKAGVHALRLRIESLFISRNIIVSFADIIAAQRQPANASLKIYSKHATRDLSLRGLFIDCDDATWEGKAQTWLEELAYEIAAPDDTEVLNSAAQHDPFEHIAEGWTIAKDHWKRINGEQPLMLARRRLSELYAQLVATGSLDTTRQTEIDVYLSEFQVSARVRDKAPVTYTEMVASLAKPVPPGYKITAKSKVLDIQTGDHDGLAFRWAALFLLAKLIAHVMRVQVKFDSDGIRRPESAFTHFNERDWLYALVPCPDEPILLPAHDTDKNNTFDSLHRRFMRLNTARRARTDDTNGNCALSLRQVFEGSGDYGLRPLERRLIEAAVIDESYNRKSLMAS
jgi:hypothetical protein